MFALVYIIFGIDIDALYDQVDGALGMVGAITEMLVQSHEGHLIFLPAIPVNEWSSGSIQAVRVRGGFLIDMTWNVCPKIVCVDATICSMHGKDCKLSLERCISTLVDGVAVPQDEFVTFGTSTGGTYRVHQEKQF